MSKDNAAPLLFVAELFLPRPERARDVVDFAARALFFCPICDARTGMSCLWAQTRAVPAWSSHAARRLLCTPQDVVDYPRNVLERDKPRRR